MPDEPALLARGPWDPDDIEVRWSDDHYAPPPARDEQADAAIAALRERGSPSHDGLAARLVSHEVHDGRLTLHLQPVRHAEDELERVQAGDDPHHEQRQVDRRVGERQALEGVEGQTHSSRPAMRRSGWSASGGHSSIDAGHHA